MSSASHPATYKAYAFLEKGGNLEPIDVKWKDPQPGEIVVKVLACGVCASDEIAKHQFFPTVTYPRIPGHEVVGDVAAVHPTDKVWKVGQRVGSGWHGGHCSVCERCRAGDFSMCSNQLVNGIGQDGGYAQYVTLKTESIISVPEDMDPKEAAPVLCAGLTAFNSIRHMNATPPDLVAVQGIGGVGHLALQVAKAMGFRTIALSSNSAKKDLATELGAQYYFDGSQVDQAEELQKLGGAKLIVCTAPNPEIIQALVGGLAVDGELLILALTGNATIPLLPFVGKRLTLRAWNTGTPKDGEDTLEFVRTTGIKCMVQTFPLEKAQEAYDHRSSAKFRAVLIP
ncbi:GroES-like protein [Laetiporus sulphureus 93-53]|uniref:GroES-like protein n=1 Tax=Laetiporus sulphureus 93-53 TaxID=1314785 RepID=A0A165IAY9_9APHY|nr:GroES-like protein [Laetiporus sulphureus 93-53]KZT12826.1 GroES-like protein [Laetiporus sulphureus 93-53]